MVEKSWLRWISAREIIVEKTWHGVIGKLLFLDLLYVA